MSPQEFWWEFDSRIVQQKKLAQGPAGFSQQAWEEARRKHREKQNDR